jgi:hypothetical protein
MRLRDGATWRQADDELNHALSGTTRARRFASTNPGAQLTYYAVSLQQAATDTLRPQVLALALAAGFIWLIACANIAGLTLVRMLRRTGEIAFDWRWAPALAGSKDSCGSNTCCWRVGGTTGKGRVPLPQRAVAAPAGTFPACGDRASR